MAFFVSLEDRDEEHSLSSSRYAGVRDKVQRTSRGLKSSLDGSPWQVPDVLWRLLPCLANMQRA